MCNKPTIFTAVTLAVTAIACAGAGAVHAKPRARDLGVPFPAVTGPLNAITDVAGIEVGHTTLVRGSGRLERGKGPVRTGVTVIFPTGKNGRRGVAAGRVSINGTGELTGMAFVDEVGQLFGPIGLTGTGNISVVRDAMTDWAAQSGALHEDELILRLLPAVGETLDLPLNDVFGHSMTEQDVFAALNAASSGPVVEGNVGGGTGMISHQFKGGIGTSSRIAESSRGTYVIGVLVQANHGTRAELRIAGIPVGEEIADLLPEQPDPSGSSSLRRVEPVEREGKNSLLIMIATDAPLQPHQLQRLARRAALGVGRTGSYAGNYSGEFALAFSTTNTSSWDGAPAASAFINDNDHATMNGLFRSCVEAVEEALANQLVASETMQGADGAKVYGLPHDRLVALLKKYHRYNPPARR